MCGVVGYIGEQQAEEILLDGLSKLEYRGYDSAGVSIFDGKELQIRKKKGRLTRLAAVLEAQPLSGSAGIGHTRWATHGAPSDSNAHPHANKAGDIALVHNGIIENHERIREWLGTRGYSFRSQTDTEVIVHLVDFFYRGDLLEAVRLASHRLEGSYALIVMSSHNPEELVVARKDSPLVIGAGEGEHIIASDIPAVLKYTKDVYFLEDGEFARVTRDSVDIVDRYGLPVFRDLFHVDWEMDAAEKGGYPHFMLKEINEEPRALKDTFNTRLTDSGLLDLDMEGLTKEYLADIRRILIVACGTAYHAGVAGKYLFEEILGIPVEVDVASEFRYRRPPMDEHDLFVTISQSGETADTLAAVRLAKRKGTKVLAITNVVGSTLSRMADMVFYTLAGPEISVASTKAYTTQVLTLVMLMMEIGRLRGNLSEEEYARYREDLLGIPEKVKTILSGETAVRKAAHSHSTCKDVFFLGRNLDYAAALEGSLKLKEVSYIHSEAFAAGELKHGPIALIEEGTLVVAVATQPDLFEKIASNIKEVKARGATVMAICPPSAVLVRDIADEIVSIPETDPMLMPILSIIPAQLFAYYCAVERGFDVDKPRNLAKSVTVE